jgi:hypothetical protein
MDRSEGLGLSRLKSRLGEGPQNSIVKGGDTSMETLVNFIKLVAAIVGAIASAASAVKYAGRLGLI